MKKLLMTMALCGLAMAGSAQKNMSQMSAKGQDPRGGVTRTRAQQVKLVGEVSSTIIANNERVKFTVDDIVYRITRDQDFLKNVEEATKFRFESAGQALNVLASHGWEVTSVYTTKGRQGDEFHYVVSCSVAMIPPYSPWLDPTFERGGKK